jgi:type IV pilus assembly protein PilC
MNNNYNVDKNARSANNSNITQNKKNISVKKTGLKLGLGITEIDFLWTARNSEGKVVTGEIRAKNEEQALNSLRRQQLMSVKLKKIRKIRSKSISKKDIAYFTRQLSTLLKAGLPLLQSIDIISKGHNNPGFSKLLDDIKFNIQSGSSFANALRSHPGYFDQLYCNLVDAGEQTGVLDNLLERLATYQEKNIAIIAKIKKAMIYPGFILLVVFAVIAILMIFVIPTFKDIFESFGATLPTPTLIVMAISDFFVKYVVLILGIPIVLFFVLRYLMARSPTMQKAKDRLILAMPIIGPIVQKASIARWSRTLGTMFSSGIPIVDSLDSVAGSSGNIIYSDATMFIKNEVTKGTSLTSAMRFTQVFPNMVTQMVSSGEESGALDSMLNKVGDFYEDEVDNSISNLSTLLEPIIIVVLGVIICLILIALYMPFFSIGKAF